jgi:hypothetical protein
MGGVPLGSRRRGRRAEAGRGGDAGRERRRRGERAKRFDGPECRLAGLSRRHAPARRGQAARRDDTGNGADAVVQSGLPTMCLSGVQEYVQLQVGCATLQPYTNMFPTQSECAIGSPPW